MLKSLVLSASLLVGSEAAAQAACDGAPVADPSAVLNNGLICATRVVAPAGERYQEEHQPSGTLTERARGPGDPMDPRRDVGSWFSEGNEICYRYDGDAQYCYTLHLIAGEPGSNNSSYSFCNGAQEVVTGVLRKPIPAAGDVSACGF